PDLTDGRFVSTGDGLGPSVAGPFTSVGVGPREVAPGDRRNREPSTQTRQTSTRAAPLSTNQRRCLTPPGSRPSRAVVRPVSVVERGSEARIWATSAGV